MKEEFSKEDEAFFASKPPENYEVKSIAEQGLGEEAEAFFTSDAPKDYETVDHATETEKLIEARAMLDAAALEDAPTEEMNIVPLRPAQAEQGFGKLADDFFKEGEAKYGSNADNGPDGDGGNEAMAA